MTVKAPGAADFPTPVTSKADGDNCVSPYDSSVANGVDITPNSSGAYGAAWVDGCWVQDVSGSLTVTGGGGSGIAIDAGYDATNASSGSDAVVMLDPGPAFPGYAGMPGVIKLAGSSGGSPIEPVDATVTAAAGTGASSSGVVRNGITAATVHQSAFGPAVGDVASAADAGGVASTDGGAAFSPVIDMNADSTAWWQGASGSWLLFGLSAATNNPSLLGGFENWTPSTPAAAAGNVTGAGRLLLPATPTVPLVDSIAGVPDQDEAFVGTSIGAGCDPGCVEGGVVRITLGSGPSVTSETAIGQGVITKPGPIAYCGVAGSASSLADVLLVIAADDNGGALYRVTDATGADPTVTQILPLPGVGSGAGQPALQADCATGTVIAASGSPGAGLLVSFDGGQGFDSLPFTDPGGAPASIRAITLSAGSPPAILVGDAAGYIERSIDGGQSWTVVNDPSNDLNLSSTANSSGGIWDLLGWLGAGGAAQDVGARDAADPFAGANLVAGPGEYAGALRTAARSTLPVISRFTVTERRFAAEPKRSTAAVIASKSRKKRGLPRGTTFRYRVSEPGTVDLFIAAKLPGRRSGHRCVPPTKRNAHRRKCTIPVFYALVRRARVGTNAIAFTGRIGRHVLAAGRYEATVLAQTPNGRRSAPRSTTFTIVKR